MSIDKFDLIQKGFKHLKEDCIGVAFLGIVNKTEIPEKAEREDYTDANFTHEFNNTKTDGYDEGSFWGSIYLPFVDDEYMHFDVHA